MSATTPESRGKALDTPLLFPRAREEAWGARARVVSLSLSLSLST